MNDAANAEKQNHPIAGVFVFTLLGLFALFAAFIVLLSAQFYRGMVDEVHARENDRVLVNYVMNTVRGNDVADSVYVESIDGIDVLIFEWNSFGDGYQTMVYYHAESIREYFCERGAALRPDYGEVICSAQSFLPTLEGNMLTVEVTDSDGSVQTMYMALRCGREEAE